MKKKDQILLEEAYQKVNENFLSKLNPFKKQQSQPTASQNNQNSNTPTDPVTDWLKGLPNIEIDRDLEPSGYVTYYSIPGKVALKYQGGKWYGDDGVTFELNDIDGVKKYVNPHLGYQPDEYGRPSSRIPTR